MEYVDGETLAGRLEREPVSLKDGVRIAVEIAEALSKAHEQRIVHRDLKPANVMLGRDGHVKVMDFGLATQVEVASTDSEAETVEGLSRRGDIAGTPGYMSPEQLRGESVDARSDLFAFGVVLQEILTGTHPFRKDSGAETMAAILKESPTGREALPGVIQPLVDQLLSKKADDRPSLEHARAELQRLVERPELLEASATPERIFVGRESELRELRNLAERLRSGKGSLALVGGEPGVGKTRLSEEILAFARNEGFLALEGHCYEMEGAQPYLPWIESLELAARLVPNGRLRDALGEAAPEVAKLVPELRRQYDDIGEPIDLPPEQQQRYLFNSIVEFLERLSREAPIVWLLDDLHWADESTLLLLQHLLQKLNDLPILLVGTYRDVELDVGKPFEKVLAQVVRQRLGHRITLRRLSEESTGELLAALGGGAPPAALVHVIYQETEGNPFFVEEVFEHLSEERKLFDEEGEWIEEMSVSELEVPEGVRLVIGRRLERLSEDTPKVLGAAAVMGRVFELRVLEAVEGLDPDVVLDAIEEGEAAKLVAPTTLGRYAFTHELIRHTLMAQLSLPRRQRMHLRVADAYAKVLGAKAEEKAADLAHHLVQAGAAVDPPRTLRYLEIAGDKALASTTAEESLYFFDTAISLDVEDKKLLADLLFKRGLAHWNLSRIEDAVADWLQALPLYEGLADRDGITSVCAAACYPHILLNRIDEGIELAEKGLLALGDTRTPEACRLLAQAGVVKGLKDYRAGLELFERAEGLLETLGDSILWAEVLSLKALLHQTYLDVRGGAECAERATRLLDSTGELWWRADALNWKLCALMMLGRVEEAAPIADELGDVARRVGNAIVLRNVPICRAVMAWLEADLDSVEVWLRRAIDASRDAGIPHWFEELGVLGVVHCFRGRNESGLEKLESAMELDPCDSPYTGVVPPMLFVVKAYASDPRALEFLEKEVPLPGMGDVNFSKGIRLIYAIEGLVVLGENKKASDLYSQASEIAKRVPVLLYFGLMPQTVAGIAAAAGGQWDKAVEHFETSLRQAHEFPHKLEQPQVRYWYAKMLTDRDAPGDRDKARQFLGEAIEAYESIDFPRHLEMAKELLGRL